MKRPFYTWMVFALAFLMVLLAVAWVSVTLWKLEENRLQGELQAEREERLRLALWRMDSMLSPLMVEEASRSPGDYQAFRSTTHAYTKSLSALEEVLIPSPLLTFASSNVLLHFQMDPARAVTSPQVPQGVQRRLALSNHGLSRSTLHAAQLRLEHLQEVLLRRTEEDLAGQIGHSQANGPLRNYDLLLLTCAPFRTNAVPLPAPNGPLPGSLPVHSPQQERQYQAPSQKANVFVQAQQQQQAQKQQLMNSAELVARDNFLQEVNVKEAFARDNVSPVLGNVQEGPLRALWIEDTLVLARRVALPQGGYIQGAWLNWNFLKRTLLETVSDLLPQADLAPMRAPLGELESHMLALLPVKLTAPGSHGLGTAFWTPVRVTLILAWLGILAAGLAVGLLLHGVVSLSERRAAFVSAVTHELRTPLTTFKMYAEMLASDMVPEPERRQAYLQTLYAESNRLSHLVENVLAYARLERGRAQGRMERISLRQLVTRVQERLAQRCRQAGMELEIELPEQLADNLAEVDVAITEQILFNLIDNACKYAGADSERKTICLAARHSHGGDELLVWDGGPGLSAEARRRLFQPFSKSAAEAATSAPGVGLGLALCQRLSRGMGAKLRYEDAAGGGACFVLRLKG